MPAIAWTVLDRIASSSGEGEYEIRRSTATGETYCTCPGWRFSGVNGRQRDCRHLTDYARRQLAQAGRLATERAQAAARLPRDADARAFACAFCAEAFPTQRALDIHMGVCGGMAQAIAPRRIANNRSRPLHMIAMDAMVRRARVQANGLDHVMNAFSRDYEGASAVGMCDRCRQSLRVWRDPVSGQDQRHGAPVQNRCTGVR